MLIVDGPQGDALTEGADGYVFGWGDSSTALALGYGSLYNHHFEPNATTTESGDELIITAVRDIDEGEEIFINYLGTAVDPDAVWFDDVVTTSTGSGGESVL